MNDPALRQDVMDELQFEPSTDAANIGVSVENRVVTLSLIAVKRIPVIYSGIELVPAKARDRVCGIWQPRSRPDE